MTRRKTVYAALGYLIAIIALLSLATMLHTQVPLAAVTSGSMTPTIKQGDLLVVEGVNPYNLHVGTIIIYRTTDPYLTDELIVHRIIKIDVSNNTIIGYITKGDNNPYPDTVYGFEPPTGIPPKDVVGKVVFVIPLLGFLVLFLKQPVGLLSIVVLLIVLVFWGFREDQPDKNAQTG
ncbi:MAG: signal peptidase I [Thermoprotei archaeon]